MHATIAGLAALACLVFAAGVAGCSQTRTYSGHTRDEVWTAMVAAAQHPRYRDWIVMDNRVWTDEAGERVEIWRELKRDVVLPGQDPYREEAQWRLRSTLEEGRDDAPVVLFSTSDLCIPAHFWLQADHFFDEVHARLSRAAAPAPITVPMDVPLDPLDPMLLPPSSVSGKDTREDIVDSVPAPGQPPPAPSGAAKPQEPSPPPAAPRPSGKSEPIDIP